jgi:hypothetical protein
MNVKFVDDIPMHLPIIQKVFERSYAFYTAGLRMYFVLIPMFAWLVTSWLLLAVTLPHLYLVYSYDNMDFIDDEVTEMYSSYQPLLQQEAGTDERAQVELGLKGPPLNGSPAPTAATGGGAVSVVKHV